MDEYEKGINSFERALALDPANKEIQKALDESRQMHDQRLRQRQLDPRVNSSTMSEQQSKFQQKSGVDPPKVPMGDDLTGEVDLSGTDVIKGHKYVHGNDDVK